MLVRDLKSHGMGSVKGETHGALVRFDEAEEFPIELVGQPEVQHLYVLAIASIQ